MTDLRRVLLTCIIDLSEYISSMVLWIRVILPCRSGGKNNICSPLVSAMLNVYFCNVTEKVMNYNRVKDKGLQM